MARITTWDCCGENQRLIVNESFSYECIVDEDTGRLYVDTNDYASDGYEGLECLNCGKEFDIQANFEEVD